jgi:succinate-semialdehyde dehydrogenase/glutarate-semialdehyde dehydrogenase
MSVTTINPATGRTLETYATHDDVEPLLSAAHTATARWGLAPLDVRTATVARLATVLRERANDIAALITAEMGKPLVEALGEVEKSAVTAEFYVARAAEFLGSRAVAIDGVDAWVAREPLGLVLAIMPWNFPLWQAMRFAVPAVTAGNGVFLKHSPNVTGSALLIQELWERAGLPAGVFTTVVVEESRVPRVTEGLIADDRIAAVTLTGSNRAGSAVGAAAGRAVKPSVLELGGSDAFVVLSDADVPAAATAAVRSRFLNAGQSCVCAKRFIVESTVADEFTGAFLAGVKELVVGDPTAPGTRMGPCARADLRDALARQVKESVDAGARLLAGGAELPGPGYFYAPTVLTGTGPGMPAFDEETFGPLAAIAVATGEEDAVRLANATRFGLGLSVWSRDPSQAAAFAGRVPTGAAFINAMVASDARVPFGGTKQSGYGRELSDIGMHEFVNTRTYWSAPAQMH